MAFKHSFSFAADLAQQILVTFDSEIVSKLLLARQQPSEVAVLFN